MNKTLSPQQIRLVALLGLLAAALLTWWMLVARQRSQSTAPAVAVLTHTTPAKPAVPLHPAKPTTKAHAAAPARPVKLATHGLPLKVATALRTHRVVVVALYTPAAPLDKLARAESQAGAAAMGAGFVSLDVLRQKEGRPLLTKLGIVEAPAVLVFKRPAKVYAQFEGFTDRDTVEQAVANARR